MIPIPREELRELINATNDSAALPLPQAFSMLLWVETAESFGRNFDTWPACPAGQVLGGDYRLRWGIRFDRELRKRGLKTMSYYEVID